MNQIVKLLKPNTVEIIDIPINKSGEETELLVLFVGRGNEHVQVETRTRHLKPGTQAYAEVRGVLFDEAKAIVKGLIAIDKHAQQTQSFLEQKILLTAPKTYAEAIPQLEIAANDVKASHAATVGQLDPEQVFSLMSRGICRATAEMMIIEGFLKPVIDRINDTKVRKEIKNIIKERLKPVVPGEL